MSPEERLTEAEAFVRRATARFKQAPLSDAKIKEVAAKVAKIFNFLP